jgi:hypothetical protein
LHITQIYHFILDLSILKFASSYEIEKATPFVRFAASFREVLSLKDKYVLMTVIGTAEHGERLGASKRKLQEKLGRGRTGGKARGHQAGGMHYLKRVCRVLPTRKLAH